MTGLPYAVTLATALGCGLVAGVFYAFSTFVMPALKRLASAQGIVAMLSINRLAVTPGLMIALFGTAAACLGLIVWAAFSSSGRTAALVVAGGALYLVGTVGVTMAGNVPLNNRLARVEPDAEGARVWDEYLARWTAWNHVRAAAALVAAGALTVALHA